MSGTAHPYAALLVALPYPSILLEGNRAAFYNESARTLLPGLSLGAPLTDFPFPVPKNDTTAAVALSGRSFRLEAKAVGNEATLLTFLPDGALSPPLLTEERWEALSEQLRVQLSDLFAASEALASMTEQAEEIDTGHAMALFNRALYRLLRLTRHLELCRRPDLDYTPAVFDLAGFCGHFCTETAPLVQLAGVELDYQPASQGLLIRGDERLLRLALLSLVSNAVKAAGTGGKITLILTRSGAQANLRLSNSGSEVSDDVLAALFRQDSVPPLGGGLGLGFPLARQIIMLHGGALMAEKNQNGGLTVALSLPPSGADAPLGVRSPCPDWEGGFSSALVELSDALPASAFGPLDIE
ncbi:MAG: HAMP domain-containing histidine kinase [Oscillospiraceae bacterium]|nr:HAMP domain-containing histidine kinase [Oscillospiraceae bacterium]